MAGLSGGKRRIAIGSAALATSAMLAGALSPAPIAPQIGIFYFPGWKDKQLGGSSPLPWAPLQNFPDRIPLAGPYQEGDPALLTRQLGEMHRAGIGFVAFDLMSTREGTPVLGTVVHDYLKMPPAQRQGMKFAILWANHTPVPETQSQFEAAVRYWIQTYMSDPDYLRVDGRPQLFVFSTWWLSKNAAVMGLPAKTLLDRAQEIAHLAGLPGIDFVASDPSTPDLNQIEAIKAQGYTGITTYGYSGDATGKLSHSFAELAADYAANWTTLASVAPPMRVFVPMTAGWDHRPWGPSPDPLHDQSRSTPTEFRAHLAAGRAFIISHPQLTGGYGMLCCWNEFGEGSHIEPTVGDQGGHLAAISNVFAPVTAGQARKR